MRRLSLVSLVVLLGCDADLERMIDQRKALPYEATSLFADGRIMRPPPSDTVPREMRLGPARVTEGLDGDAYAATLPVPLTRPLMELGRARFETFCSTCHGVRGDSDTWTARSMMQRKPAVLIDDRVRAFPPGRIFRVITEGYGLMRAYAHELPVEERWAVVAYLRALQLSHAVPLERLPAGIRRQAEEALR